MTYAAWVCILAPASAAMLLGLLAIRGTPSERLTVAISRGSFVAGTVAALVVLASVILDGPREVFVGSWFAVGEHSFDLALALDLLSASMMVLTLGACSLIGHFSRTYLHAEPGHTRFYFLLSVFCLGMLLIVAAESIDFLFVGWELVGITSALLIAFFHERPTPVRNGIRAFATYRICDMALLTGIIMLHHYAHDANMQPAHGFWGIGEGLTSTEANVVAIALVVGAMGKSAQFPLGGWLRGAMEGPTPSSAIFYGALSVHAGVYLLIRAVPLFAMSQAASVLLVVVGALTAVTATLTGRVQSDVKGTLAYATMTQVGLMFVEVGLHLPELAAIHLVGHACLRTSQFLRAPAILHELHAIHGALPHELETGRVLDSIERKLPLRIGTFAYMHALDAFHVDALIRRFLINPFFELAGALARIERWLTGEQPRAVRAVVPLSDEVAHERQSHD